MLLLLLPMMVAASVHLVCAIPSVDEAVFNTNVTVGDSVELTLTISGVTNENIIVWWIRDVTVDHYCDIIASPSRTVRSDDHDIRYCSVTFARFERTTIEHNDFLDGSSDKDQFRIIFHNVQDDDTKYSIACLYETVNELGHNRTLL